MSKCYIVGNLMHWLNYFYFRQTSLQKNKLRVSMFLYSIYPAFSQTSIATNYTGAQWLSCRVLDSRPRGGGFEPHRRHCVVSLSKKINPSLVLVQPRKTYPFLTERLLIGRKESLRQTNKATVVPTKSDSDVTFCLQLLSKILTCTLRLC